MKKVTFDKLIIQNFLSIGNDTVVIEFQKGLNLITGRNNDNPERVNGVGKSVLIDAFYFALFGKTIREIKKEFIVNNITKGKGLIELYFTVEDSSGIHSYKITRQVKPSKVQLYKGDEDITRDSISNTDSFISELLGTNSVLCRSCDILSLSDNVPFMAKTAAEKRKFIEDIFSLEIFSKMVKDLKEQIKNNKSDISISDAKLGEIENSLETLKKQEEAFKKNLKEREERLQKRKDEIESSINSLEKKISEFVLTEILALEEEKEKYDNALPKIEAKILEQTKKISEKETSLSYKNRELKKVDSVDGAECDKCLQKIGEDHKSHLEEMKNVLESDISSIKNDISTLKEGELDLQGKKSKIKNKINSLSKQISDGRLKNNELLSMQSKLEGFENDLKQVEEDLKESVEDNSSFKESIDEVVKRQKDQKEDKTKLQQIADDLKVCSFVLGEEGVKSFVIKKLLGMLNNSIQNYITDLGMNIICKFDEYFEESMSNDKGKPISYWNLSGGERRTIDLACAWAFKDLKQKISGVSSNLEFCDEIFDSAFDERGMDLLIEVIKERISKHKVNVYAISHRKETYKHIEGEIVMLEKDNGITRRVDE